MQHKKGLFITLEGIDGSGKSTQIALLQERIEAQGLACAATAEPSAGPVGSLLRQFLSGRMKADEATLAALFAADRLDHLLNKTDGICAKTKQGICVLCDRYLLSNYAYQGVNLPFDWIRELNRKASDTLKPDCHIFIDVAPDTALERMAKGRFHTDLYETKDRLTKVRSTYLSLIDRLKNEETIFVIDGNRGTNLVSEEIWQKLSPFFG